MLKNPYFKPFSFIKCSCGSFFQLGYYAVRATNSEGAMEGILTTLFMMIYFPQTAIAGYIWAKSLKFRNLSVATTALEFAVIVLTFLVAMRAFPNWNIISFIAINATFAGVFKATYEMGKESK